MWRIRSRSNCVCRSVLYAAPLLCLALVLSSQAASQAKQPEDEPAETHSYLPLLSRGYVLYQESSGTLDTSFDGDGLVLTDLTATDDEGLSLAIQPNGRLLVGGEVGIEITYTIDMALARYNRDGSLDTSFGVGGWVRTDLDGWNDSASDLALQPDGKILQSGSSRGDFALVRYNADGSLDTTFNGVGWARTDLGSVEDESKAIALQPDGKIIVAGYALALNGRYDFALVRYNLDGSLDTSFGDNGRVTTDLTDDNDQGQALAILPDGRIILVGSVKRELPYYRDFGLVCYLPDGIPDPSFGINGQVITDINGGRDFAYAVTLHPDQKIVVAGAAQDGADGDYDFALARYTFSGGLDTSFSSDGKVTMDFNGGDDYAYGVTLQPDGKVIAAGYASNGLNFDFAVARCRTNGSLDTSFAGDGRIVTDLAGGDDTGLAVVLQADGKIVVAGNAYNGGNTDFALVRYK
jgi:uncharacterized delta-60 repeat protein